MNEFDQKLKEMQQDRALDEAIRLSALSGGGTGALVGAASSLIGGKRRLLDYVKSSLIGGAGGAAISGGSVGLGGAMLGPASDLDEGAYTKRGALGGAAAGGALGAGLGAFAGAGGLSLLDKALNYGPQGFADKTRGAFNQYSDNLVGDYFKKWAKGPRLSGALKGGAVGGLALGGLASFLGSDEGMQVDFINNELRKKQMDMVRRQIAMGEL